MKDISEKATELARRVADAFALDLAEKGEPISDQVREDFFEVLRLAFNAGYTQACRDVISASTVTVEQ